MNIKDVREFGVRIGNGGKTRTQLVVDAAAIRELAELLGATGLTEIEIEHGGQRLRVARHAASMMAYSGGVAPATAAPETPRSGAAGEASATKREAPSAGTVTSPMVGTVFVAPEPGKPAFVKIGDRVSEGDTLLIVEAMKTMNPILAPRAGTISEICITDAQPVEFGQALLVIS